MMFDDSKPSRTDERLSYALLSLVGEVVAVHLADGRVMEGIFASKSDDEGLRVILLQARLRPSTLVGLHDVAQCKSVVVLDEADVIMIDAANAPLKTANAARGRVDHANRQQFPGEMQRWAEMGDDEPAEMLEEDTHREGSWDQFEANKKKFGVTSSYSEEQYTTKLDKKKITAEQQRKADEIERGILARGTKGIQHELERGGTLATDEGTAFSDVQRGAGGAAAAPALPVRSTGAYVPPSQRKQTAGSPTPQVAAAPAAQTAAPAAQPQTAAAPPAAAAPQPAAATSAPAVPKTAPPAAQSAPAAAASSPLVQPTLRATAAEWRPPSSSLGAVAEEYSTEALPDNNDFLKKITSRMRELRDKIIQGSVEPLMSREWPGDDVYMEDSLPTQPGAQAYYPPQPQTQTMPPHHQHHQHMHHQQQHMHHAQQPQHHQQHHQQQHMPHQQHQHQSHPMHHGGGGGGYPQQQYGAGGGMGGGQGGYNPQQQGFGPGGGGNYQSPHGGGHGGYHNQGAGAGYGPSNNQPGFVPRNSRGMPPMSMNGPAGGGMNGPNSHMGNNQMGPGGMGGGMDYGRGAGGGGYQDPMSSHMGHMGHQNNAPPMQAPMHSNMGGGQNMGGGGQPGGYGSQPNLHMQQGPLQPQTSVPAPNKMGRGGMSVHPGNAPPQAHPMPQQHPSQPQQPQQPTYQPAPQVAPQPEPKRAMTRGRGGGAPPPESAAPPQPAPAPAPAPQHNQQSNPPGASVAVSRPRGGKR